MARSNEHVRMMRRLREKYNESAADRGWLARIVNRDSADQPLRLRSRHYEVSELMSRGLTCRDFLLDRISWSVMRRLGYTLSEASELGFTTDDLLALSITNDDLLSERQYIVACKCKDLVSSVCCTRDELNRWMPAELFRLGFTRSELVSKFNFSPSDISCESFRQYYGGDGWSEVTSLRTEVPDVVAGRIAGPTQVDKVPNLKIDMKKLAKM